MFGLAYGSTVRGVIRMLCIVGVIGFTWLIYPLVIRLSKRARMAYTRWFHAMLTRSVGLRVVVQGAPVRAHAGLPVLYVSNHSSYMDIPVLGQFVDGSFIAKSDMESWPVVKQLCRIQDTLFVHRTASEARAEAEKFFMRLVKGDSLVLFPEGTTSDGQRILPFKSSLFATAYRPDAPPVCVQPITIMPVALDGLPLDHTLRPLYAWYGDMSLFDHLWPLVRLNCLTVSVIFHAPVHASDFPDRKALTHACETIIRQQTKA